MNPSRAAIAAILAFEIVAGITSPERLFAQEAGKDSTVKRKRPPIRRIAVTPELDRTAYSDSRARTLVERARLARMAQDSALRAYDAQSFLRMSVSASVAKFAPEKLLLRTEQVARVRWSRNANLLIEPLAKRSAFPLGSADLYMTEATPIPYFPGREALWIPSDGMSTAQAEVNENDFLHPLATGAEAYYTYQTGDSLSIRLPDGKVIALRELKVAARRPDASAFVGSFWFDVDRGSLVRAAYRLAADIDLWRESKAANDRRIEDLIKQAAQDTGKTAEAARREAKRLTLSPWEKIALKALEGSMRPARATMSGITVEYALYDGRFWLPKLNTAEGEVALGFIRVPLRWQESFRYDMVTGNDSAARAITAIQQAFASPDTGAIADLGQVTIGGAESRRDTASLATRRERDEKSLKRFSSRVDSLRARARIFRDSGDTARARVNEEIAETFAKLARSMQRRLTMCTHDSLYYTGTQTRYDGALRTTVRMPCNPAQLDTSSLLTGSIYGDGEEVFGSVQRDELLNTLTFSLQPKWMPRKPEFLTGLTFMRYNRIEGLSIGGSTSSLLGKGYAVELGARYGIADHAVNGDLTLTRSNGPSNWRLGAFRRLGVANDDWGAPLSVGASIMNLLNARDEGFYYRTWGAELGGTRAPRGPLDGSTVNWRLFAERQTSAGREPNTQASLGNAVGNKLFVDNIEVRPTTTVGLSTDIMRTFGANARRLRVNTRLRLEGAYTLTEDSLSAAEDNRTNGYGRFLVDASMSRPIWRFNASLATAAGTSVGELPIQRAFYVGGLHTVRGQFARADSIGRVGNAFWLVRSELGIGTPALRMLPFYDIGWAGNRTDFSRPGRPLSGAGVGFAFLDGMFRFDIARGIWPEKRRRMDFYLQRRF